MEEGQEWAVQCHRVTSVIPHSTRIVPGMDAQRWVVRTVPGSDSQAAIGDRRGGDSPLSRAPAVC
jgi:hypothetical protein